MRQKTRRAMASLLLLGGVCLLGCGKAATPPGNSGADATTASIAGSNGAPAVDSLHPVVLLDTTLGEIKVRLDAERAPLTVANFLGYVDSGFYDQTVVHQVFRGQGVVGGGLGPDMREKPNRTTIRNEADNGLANLRGTIAMVRSPDVIDSARSQFFFNLADNPALNHRDRTTPDGYGYCVFGQVVAGLDVLDRIGETPVHDTAQFDATPNDPILVKSVRRVQ